MRQKVAETCAIPSLLDQAWKEALAQTTIRVRLAPKFCLLLFCLNRAQCVKNELDDRVIFQGRQCDDFTGGGDNHPEDRACQDFFDAHDYAEGGRASSLDTLCSTVLNLANISFLSSLISV